MRPLPLSSQRARAAGGSEDAGRPEDAEPLLRKALGALNRSGSPPGQALLELAETLVLLGQNAEAEDLYTRALGGGESADGDPQTMLKIAALREARGNSSGSKRAYLDALEQFDNSGPLTEGHRKARATALNDLGLLLESEGDLDDAETAYRRSADDYAEVFGSDHPGTATARANLAGMLAMRGEAAAAAAHLERAIDVFRAAYGPRHGNTAGLRSRLGEIYEAQGRFEEAEAEYLAVLGAWPEPSASRGLALADLGRLAGVRGDFAAAEAVLSDAVGLLQPAPPALAVDLAEALDSYGSVLRERGRLDEAQGVLRKALAIREQELGPSHSDVALTLVGLAGVLHLQGDLGSAEPLYRRAIGIQERALGPAHPEVGETLYNLAHLEQALGDIPAAEKNFRRSAEILSSAYGPDDPFVAEIRAAIRALR
jgi:tetratricopeptide (TPR) repeat protein